MLNTTLGWHTTQHTMIDTRNTTQVRAGTEQGQVDGQGFFRHEGVLPLSAVPVLRQVKGQARRALGFFLRRRSSPT